ncbi:MAG: hypothetical protein WBG01_04775 [Bacteroidota bacterium]
MIYAALFGLFLGVYEISPLPSVGVVIGVVVLRALLELASRENFITRRPSSYILYKQDLEKRGSLPHQPWRGFLTREIWFGTAVGIAVYGTARLIVSMQGG